MNAEKKLDFDPCRDCTSHKAVTGTQRIILWLIGGIGALFIVLFSSVVVLYSTVSAGEQVQKTTMEALKAIQQDQEVHRVEMRQISKDLSKTSEDLAKTSMMIDFHYKEMQEIKAQGERNKKHIMGIEERERQRGN